MGAGIPLPALHVEAPQQPDTLGNFQKLLAIKNAQAMAPLQQQEARQSLQSGAIDVQQKQQQLKDQQAMTAAMQGWDGKDYDSLVQGAIKNGASANTVMQIRKTAMESQKNYSEVLKNNAAAGADQISTQMKKNDLVAGAISSVLSQSDEALPNALTQTANQLAQQGLIDPQHVQQAQQIAQSGNPAAIRQQLDFFKKGYMADSAQMKEALDKAQQFKDTQQGNEAAANANKITQEMQLGTGPMAESKYRNILMNEKLNRPVSAEDQAWKSAYEKQKTLVPTATFNLNNGGITKPGGQPSAMAQAVADGSMKWSDVISTRTPMKVKQDFLSEVKQVNPNFNSGDFTVEQKVKEKYTSGNVADQLLAINTAREHMKTFAKLAEALDTNDVQALNKIGQAVGVQFGSDKKTNFDIAAQAFGGEVGRAFDGAGVTAGERKQAEDSYKSAMSIGQFKGAVSTVDELLSGKQRSAQQSYEKGKKAQPNFGNQQEQNNGAQGGGTTQHSPGAKAGLQEGATGKGSDGQNYVVKGGVWVRQ